MLCVDPDVPSPTAGTRERPLLHWMVVNIPEGRMGEGDTVMSYRGPRPPDAAHYYYFLLYEQSHVINTNQTANYTSPTGSRYQNLSVLTIPLTCTFRINIFKSLPQVFLHENRKYLFWILIYLFKPRAE